MPFFSPLLCLAPCVFTTEYCTSTTSYRTVRRTSKYIPGMGVFMHTERCSCSVLLYCCCCRSCCCLLLLFVIVCRMAFFFAGIESDSSVFLLFIQKRYILNVPLGSTVASTASICLHYVHPRQLRACSEPRRASGRRDEAPLVHDAYLFRRI